MTKGLYIPLTLSAPHAIVSAECKALGSGLIVVIFGLQEFWSAFADLFAFVGLAYQPERGR